MCCSNPIRQETVNACCDTKWWFSCDVWWYDLTTEIVRVCDPTLVDFACWRSKRMITEGRIWHNFSFCLILTEKLTWVGHHSVSNRLGTHSGKTLFLNKPEIFYSSCSSVSTPRVWARTFVLLLVGTTLAVDWQLGPRSILSTHIIIVVVPGAVIDKTNIFQNTRNLWSKLLWSCAVTRSHDNTWWYHLCINSSFHRIRAFR